MTAPVLVLGWGNLSRGGDALGPMFIAQLRAQLGYTGTDHVEFLEDYQLQVEHAFDLEGRTHVLFVDASLTCASPFEVMPLQPVRDTSFTTHAMSPEAVMQVYRDLHDAEPPACTLLAIRGERFGLGEEPGAPALAHLAMAVEWGTSWVPARLRKTGAVSIV